MSCFVETCDADAAFPVIHLYLVEGSNPRIYSCNVYNPEVALCSFSNSLQTMSHYDVLYLSNTRRPLPFFIWNNFVN